jgi:hypothetical protein
MLLQRHHSSHRWPSRFWTALAGRVAARTGMCKRNPAPPIGTLGERYVCRCGFLFLRNRQRKEERGAFT